MESLPDIVHSCHQGLCFLPGKASSQAESYDCTMGGCFAILRECFLVQGVSIKDEVLLAVGGILMQLHHILVPSDDTFRIWWYYYNKDIATKKEQ